MIEKPLHLSSAPTRRLVPASHFCGGGTEVFLLMHECRRGAPLSPTDRTKSATPETHQLCGLGSKAADRSFPVKRRAVNLLPGGDGASPSEFAGSRSVKKHPESPGAEEQKPAIQFHAHRVAFTPFQHCRSTAMEERPGNSYPVNAAARAPRVKSEDEIGRITFIGGAESRRAHRVVGWWDTAPSNDVTHPSESSASPAENPTLVAPCASKASLPTQVDCRRVDAVSTQDPEEIPGTRHLLSSIAQKEQRGSPSRITNSGKCVSSAWDRSTQMAFLAADCPWLKTSPSFCLNPSMGPQT